MSVACHLFGCTHFSETSSGESFQKLFDSLTKPVGKMDHYFPRWQRRHYMLMCKAKNFGTILKSSFLFYKEQAVRSKFLLHHQIAIPFPKLLWLTTDCKAWIEKQRGPRHYHKYLTLDLLWMKYHETWAIDTYWLRWRKRKGSEQLNISGTLTYLSELTGSVFWSYSVILSICDVLTSILSSYFQCLFIWCCPQAHGIATHSSICMYWIFHWYLAWISCIILSLLLSFISRCCVMKFLLHVDDVMPNCHFLLMLACAAHSHTAFPKLTSPCSDFQTEN